MILPDAIQNDRTLQSFPSATPQGFPITAADKRGTDAVLGTMPQKKHLPLPPEGEGLGEGQVAQIKPINLMVDGNRQDYDPCV